jgi:hypothetical protein
MFSAGLKKRGKSYDCGAARGAELFPLSELCTALGQNLVFGLVLISAMAIRESEQKGSLNKCCRFLPNRSDGRQRASPYSLLLAGARMTIKGLFV